MGQQRNGRSGWLAAEVEHGLQFRIGRQKAHFARAVSRWKLHQLQQERAECLARLSDRQLLPAVP
jgi:hypothetical protein